MKKSLIFAAMIATAMWIAYSPTNSLAQAGGGAGAGGAASGSAGGGTSGSSGIGSGAGANSSMGSQGSSTATGGSTTSQSSNRTALPSNAESGPPTPGSLPENQSTNSGQLGNANSPTPITPTAPYPNSALPNASNPNPNNPSLGSGSGTNYSSGNNINSRSGIGAQPQTNQFDMNRNAQDRLDLRHDRQDLREDRQADRQANRSDADRSRFMNYNGEWWYWMPGNYWMYYRDNNWNRYEPDSFQPFRYSTGYRGDVDRSGMENNSTFFDEYGRQYRRDYSPLRRALHRAEENEAQINVTTPQIGVTTGGAANGTSPNVGVGIGDAAGNNR